MTLAEVGESEERLIRAPLPPAQPAEPREPEIFIGEGMAPPYQKQLGKEGVGAAPLTADELGKLLDRAAPGADYLAASLRGQFPMRTEAGPQLPPLPAKPKRSDGWDGQPEALAAYLRGAPPAAAAVPEAGALWVVIDELKRAVKHERHRGDSLLINKRKVSGLLSEAHREIARLRALSSPSGDARPPSAIETAAAKLIEVGQHCTLGFRHACEHCDAWEALDAAVRGSPVAPSVPEEPKAASQKEGGKTCEVCGCPAPTFAAYPETNSRKGICTLGLDHWRLGYERERAEVLRLTKDVQEARTASEQSRFLAADKQEELNAALRRAEAAESDMAAAEASTKALREALEAAIAAQRYRAEASPAAYEGSTLVEPAIDAIDMCAACGDGDWPCVNPACWVSRGRALLAPPNPSAEKLTPDTDRLHACDPFEGGVGMADAALARLSEPSSPAEKLTPDPGPRE